MTTRKNPLHDITVVEWCEGISGPYCGKLFADLGATVIKIEPRGGDWTRRRSPFLGGEPHPESGAERLRGHDRLP
ncbi:MAG: CoA transferase [Chloroflexi bacterium]|nr:CoA transferase [Chloroflexota bacterium]